MSKLRRMGAIAQCQDGMKAKGKGKGNGKESQSE
jgi:hypothetical protein